MICSYIFYYFFNFLLFCTLKYKAKFEHEDLFFKIFEITLRSVCAKIWDFTGPIVCFPHILTSQYSDRFRRFLSLKVFEIFMFKLCLRLQRAKNWSERSFDFPGFKVNKFKAWPVDVVQHATHVTSLSSASSYCPVSHGSIFHLQRRQSPNDEAQHEMCVQYADWCIKSVYLCLCVCSCWQNRWAATTKRGTESDEKPGKQRGRLYLTRQNWKTC